MKTTTTSKVNEQLRSDHIELLEKLQLLLNENNALKSKGPHTAIQSNESLNSRELELTMMLRDKENEVKLLKSNSKVFEKRLADIEYKEKELQKQSKHSENIIREKDSKQSLLMNQIHELEAVIDLYKSYEVKISNKIGLKLSISSLCERITADSYDCLCLKPERMRESDKNKFERVIQEKDSMIRNMAIQFKESEQLQQLYHDQTARNEDRIQCLNKQILDDNSVLLNKDVEIQELRRNIMDLTQTIAINNDRNSKILAKIDSCTDTNDLESQYDGDVEFLQNDEITTHSGGNSTFLTHSNASDLIVQGKTAMTRSVFEEYLILKHENKQLKLEIARLNDERACWSIGSNNLQESSRSRHIHIRNENTSQSMKSDHIALYRDSSRLFPSDADSKGSVDNNSYTNNKVLVCNTTVQVTATAGNLSNDFEASLLPYIRNMQNLKMSKSNGNQNHDKSKKMNLLTSRMLPRK